MDSRHNFKSFSIERRTFSIIYGTLETSVSDPYHLVGSGSVSGSVDMDPGSAKGFLRQKVYIFKNF